MLHDVVKIRNDSLFDFHPADYFFRYLEEFALGFENIDRDAGWTTKDSRTLWRQGGDVFTCLYATCATQLQYYSISRVLSRRSHYRSNRAHRTSDYVNNNIKIPAIWPAWFSRQKFLSAKDMDTQY